MALDDDGFSLLRLHIIGVRADVPVYVYRSPMNWVASCICNVIALLGTLDKQTDC